MPSNAGGVGSIPGQGTKIPHASRPRKQNIKQKQHCNKFNKDLLKNDPHQKTVKKKKKNVAPVHIHLISVNTTPISALSCWYQAFLFLLHLLVKKGN